MGSPQAPPERGDLVQVDWVDIYEDATGDPRGARLARRTSFALFWAKEIDDGTPVLVTTTTIDHDGADGQQGFCIYPEACVKRLKVVKRARRARKGKSSDRATL